MYAAQSFTDYDGVFIEEGTELGEAVRRGYCSNRGLWFWNTIKDGKVTSVTLYRVPMRPTKEALEGKEKQNVIG